MPLHLLGKKSWNVYNTDNIARVRRDEAAAKAKEEAEEQRMQEIDAERRLAILRGEVPPPLPPAEADDSEPRARDRDGEGRPRERKKRKRAGEDNTDFELRVAKERSDVVQAANDTLRKSMSSAPIVDRMGHIDLFGEERKQGRHLKNEEAEKEAARKKKEFEDQYTMRFSNAAGKDGLGAAWYANSGSRAELAESEPPGKDAFGNEDPGRKKRDADRIVASDPLAMMKRGAAKVREVKKERQKVEAERQRDLEQLRREEKRKERHEREKRDHRRRSERQERESSRDDREHRHRDREDRDRHRGRENGDSEHRQRDHHRSTGDRDKHRGDDRHRDERSSRHGEEGKGREKSHHRDRSRDERGHSRHRERHEKDSASRRRDDGRRRDDSTAGDDRSRDYKKRSDD